VRRPCAALAARPAVRDLLVDDIGWAKGISNLNMSQEPSIDSTKDTLVSVVIPVFDEEDCVVELKERLFDVAVAAGVSLEAVFVDDGSKDRTLQRIMEMRSRDDRVKVIRFTRSFGHQAALCAGLRFARGDAVVTMDGDLQHPPELIPELLEHWREGTKVVQAVRFLPPGSRPPWKELVGRLFYRVINAAGRTPVVPAGADFRLLDRQAVDALNECGETSVFLRGLVPWLGFPTVEVPYELAPRFAGEGKYSMVQMARLALNGLLSFSNVALHLITVLGFTTTLLGLCFGFYVFIWDLLGGVPVRGWTSVLTIVLVFGGVQLVSIGVVSEYVGRVYDEVKHRPRYVIQTKEGVE